MTVEATLSELVQARFPVDTCTCEKAFNKEAFGLALQEFTLLRLEIHRRRKAPRSVMDAGLFVLFSEATRIRHTLEALAPCPSCIARLNPTNRKGAKAWNPHRQRAYREALR